MIPRFALPPLVEDLGLAYRLRPAEGPAEGLVILLHGVGSNETTLSGLAANLPDQLAVALVRSPLAMGPNAFGFFAVNFASAGPRIDADAAEASRRRLAAFVAALQARTGIAPARTIVAGFSQGGIMSAGLALTEPARVAGFGLLSGRILEEIRPLIAPRAALAHLGALVAHGEADQVLPVARAEASVALLEELGVPRVLRRYPGVGHEIPLAMAEDFRAWVVATLALDPAA